MQPVRSLDDLEPLVDFYARTLGKLPGQLMVALSLLGDVKYTEGWEKSSYEARLSVDLAGAIIGDVLKQLLAEVSDSSVREEVEALLARWQEDSSERGDP